MTNAGEDTQRDAVGILYISYDGMLEPLGQSQVLAYLSGLAPGYRIHLVSFEKSEDWSRVAERQRIGLEVARLGVTWHPLRYHRRPSVVATAVDIALGTILGWRLALRHHLRIVHARSYVAALMALAIKRVTGAALVFDMRGFWADERVDGGLWPPGGLLYRLAKWWERRLLRAADHVVAVTHAAVREMERFPYLQGRMPPTSVIPTCADLTRFRPAAAGGGKGSFTLGYVGSVGTWYLFDAVAACFAQLLRMRPGARLLVVNRGAHNYVRSRLAAAGVPESAVELVAANHAEVPAHMATMDAGIFFIKPSFSKRAAAPVRLAEFLGCGIPCLGNGGVGDVAEVLEGERVGVVVRAFDESSLAGGLERLLDLVADPGTRERCVAVARRHYALEDGVAKYRSIYESMLPGSAAIDVAGEFVRPDA